MIEIIFLVIIVWLFVVYFVRIANKEPVRRSRTNLISLTKGKSAIDSQF